MLTLDRHIAISAGWVAGPAAGVAIMGAPEALELSSHIASVVCFYGGSIVFAVTVLAVFIHSLKTRGRKKIRPVFLVGAGVFLAGAIWYFWPHQQKEIARTQPERLTLEKLYETDFPDLVSTETRISGALRSRNTNSDITIEIRFKRCQDFRSHLSFAVIYFPSGKDVTSENVTLAIIQSLVQTIPKTMADLAASVVSETSSPGESFESSQSPFENGCGGHGGCDSSSGCGPERAVAGWPTLRARPGGIQLT